MVVAALALSLALAGGDGSPPAGTDFAEAADCVPVEHTKKHIHKKKVRRNGRLVTRRKKHIHRWTTCEPVPPLTCTEPSSNLGVTARDTTGSSFTLSRSCVTAGAVTVQLNNQGEDPHNVFLRPIGGPDPGYSIPAGPPYELGPLSQDEGTFSLSAGEWYLWCDLLLHEEQGMNAHLTVR
jgi:hypothetical protein